MSVSGCRCYDGKAWSSPVRAAKVDDRAHWNPVLFRDDQDVIHHFFKVGVDEIHWSTFWASSVDNGENLVETGGIRAWRCRRPRPGKKQGHPASGRHMACPRLSGVQKRNNAKSGMPLPTGPRTVGKPGPDPKTSSCQNKRQRGTRQEIPRDWCHSAYILGVQPRARSCITSHGIWLGMAYRLRGWR